MKYLVSLLMGVLVGAIYAAVHVKSPAPPIIALIGLLGIVIGEVGCDFVRQCLVKTEQPAAAYTRQINPEEITTKYDEYNRLANQALSASGAKQQTRLCSRTS